jgi:hypothetical protein
MTLSNAGNNVGGNLAISGSTGTFNGTIGGTASVAKGTFQVNGVTIAGAQRTVVTDTTTPAAGQGAGGTTISSALTDVAPVSQILAAGNLASAPTAVSIVAEAVALLTGGTTPAVAGAAASAAGPGTPSEGGDGGPAVSPVGAVIAPPAPATAAAPGAPSPAAARGAPPPPAIVLSGGPPPTGPGAPPLVPTTAPPPPATVVTNIGGATARPVNGGAFGPPSSNGQTAVSRAFPSF